jgi:hypothetical protein
VQQYQNVIQDKFGNVIVGASVAVYVYGTTTPATIYSGNGTGLLPSNTVTTNSLGEFAFYAANGRYSLTVTATNFVAENYSDFILYDPADLGAVAASGVAFTPFGTIAATNVQNAVQEVVTDLSGASGSSLVGFLQSGTGAVTRTAQSKFRDTISVKDFGAVGNGIVDDTAAIQAAINAACDNAFNATAEFDYKGYGGTIFFPTGIYRITSTLEIYTGAVHLVGDGNWQSAIFLETVSSSVDAVRFTRQTAPPGKPVSVGNGSGGGVYNLCIEMKTAGTGRDALRVDGWAQIAIDHVWIKNAGRYGVFLGNVVAGSIHDIFVQNSKTAGIWIGVGGATGDTSTALVASKLYVSGVTGDGTQSYGMWITDLLGSSINGAIIEGVVGTDADKCAGIRATGAVQATFLGSYFEGNKGWDVDLGTGSDTPMLNLFGLRSVNNPGYQLTGCGSIRIRSNNGGGVWGQWSNDQNPLISLDSTASNFTVDNVGRGNIYTFVKYNGTSVLKNYNGRIVGTDSNGNTIQEGSVWLRIRNGGRLWSYNTAPGFAGAEVGDCAINNTPAIGSPAGWLCSNATGPTYVTIAGQAAAQSNSTAATLADLVTDFNALLVKLRASGALTP